MSLAFGVLRARKEQRLADTALSMALLYVVLAPAPAPAPVLLCLRDERRAVRTP